MPSYVDKISSLRIEAAKVIAQADELLSEISQSNTHAGREIALAKTKFQEGRMWAGQALSYFPTGFQPSDVPGMPETNSKDTRSSLTAA